MKTMRNILESTYKGKATVYRFEMVKLVTGESRQEKITAFENIPCALSSNGSS